MVLDGHVFTVPDGVRGFDANLIIPPNAAAAFIQRGYRFCVRYVRRQTVHDFDLTPDEADGLIGAGLGLMVVQHVESETAWTPTAAKGAANGDVAATEAQQIGVPPGGMVWWDLEGVTVGTPAAQVIDYCNQWHAAVAGAGYVPGLYVGFHCGLDATQLYRDRKSTRLNSSHDQISYAVFCLKKKND